MISVLIPFRAPARTWRDRLRSYTETLWSQLPGVEVIYEDDGGDGVFNLSRAVNRCRAEASGSVLLIHGCDQLPPSAERLDELRATMATRPWASLYAMTHEFTEAQTRAILDGAEPGIPLGPLYGVSTCILALRADVWDDVGGLDERFEGWGYEDNALRSALGALYPDGDPVGHGTAMPLWHPPASRDRQQANKDLYAEYVAAAEAGEMRAYLTSLRAR